MRCVLRLSSMIRLSAMPSSSASLRSPATTGANGRIAIVRGCAGIAAALIAGRRQAIAPTTSTATSATAPPKSSRRFGVGTEMDAGAGTGSAAALETRLTGATNR